ncbi:hypothetical protein BGX21_006905 [Mortierella sp. AD011]|nr:hypothetical protein BGX20_000293 [Mortierella sp. AD010]KAF9399026.1 hypothetical protein BGX21_006905 [Mortierella sp. AD011]
MAHQNNINATGAKAPQDPLTKLSQSHTRQTDAQDTQKSHHRIGNSRARVRKSLPVPSSKFFERPTSIATAVAAADQTNGHLSNDAAHSLSTVQRSGISRTRRRTNSTSSTSTTYLRKAAAAVIASVHQTHLRMQQQQQQKQLQQQKQQQQFGSAQALPSESFDELRALYDEREDGYISPTDIEPEYRHSHHYYQYNQPCEPGDDDAVVPQSYLRHSQTQSEHYQGNFSSYNDFYQGASRAVSAQVVPEYGLDIHDQQHPDDNWVTASYPSAYLRSEAQVDPTNSHQRRQRSKIQQLPKLQLNTQLHQQLESLPATANKDIPFGAAIDSYLVPESNAEHEILAARFNRAQIDHYPVIESEEVMATGHQHTPNGDARMLDGQYCDDHNGHEGLEGRYHDRNYNPSQNIHNDLISPIRSSFLVSQGNSNKNNNAWDLEMHSEAEQQPWLGYIEEQIYSDTDILRRQQEEARDRLQEQHLLDTISQLEQEVIELRDANRELQAFLHESEERYDCLATEFDARIRQIQDEHELSKGEMKRRAKSFHDEAMKKREKEEEKRLTSMQEHVGQLEASNKELCATIRAMQRERFETERSQRDDLAVLSSFLQNDIIPTLHNMLVMPVEMEKAQADDAKLVSVPLALQTDTLWDKVHGRKFMDKLVESPDTISPPASKSSTVASDMDSPSPLLGHLPSKEEHSGSRSCATLRGQKCLKLLEHLWTILITVSPTAAAGHREYSTASRGDVGDEDQTLWRKQQKRHSDSSISSGKTLVVPHLIIPSNSSYFIATATTTEHSDTLTTSAFGGHKEAQESLDREADMDIKLEHHLAKQRAEHKLEIEKIKQQCVRLYRESLEGVRTEMLAKFTQKCAKNHIKKSS